MPDLHDAIQPYSEPPGDEATMEQESPGGAPALRKEGAGGTQSVSNSCTSEREAATPFVDLLAPETKRHRAPAKPPVLQSFGSLLRAAYGGKRKHLNPRKTEIAAIRFRLKLEPTEREELLSLSASDRTLERTLNLMLLSMEGLDASVLASQVQEFVHEVLRRHPAFLTQSLVGVLENRPEGASEEGAVRSLTSQSYAALKWSEGLPPLNKKEAEQCRVNALCCLLLLFRQTRGTAFEQIQHYLQTSIWTPAARRHKTDSQKLSALMRTRDPAGIAVACSMLERQALDQSQQADAARRAEERAAMRAKNLESELAGVKAVIETANAEVERLTKEIDTIRRAHENEKAHMHNDYDELRGRVLRCLRVELSLLDEGLQALKRTPPKVHVMIDHADRAIEGLKREMERIRGEG